MLNVTSKPSTITVIRGAPINKLTDILITDISAIKSTDSNTDVTTSMNSSLLLLQMLQI